MKTTTTTVDKSQMMFFAHRLYKLRSRGMFAWTWKQCLTEAWRQYNKIAKDETMRASRATVENSATVWSPTQEEINGIYAILNQYKINE